MRGKNYKAIKEKAPADAVDLKTAVAFLQENAKGKFDQTIELHMRLGVDASKSDQMVRTTLQLPAGAAKKARIAVFTDNAAHHQALREAGATLVGGQELISQVEKTGKLDADIVVATPPMMPKIAKVARILGPQGLMPNPKTGTVTSDPAVTVKELAAGKITVKMDTLGNIHEAIGKVSWDVEKVVANAQAVLDAVRASRPAAMKGQLIRSCALKSTMSPSIRITF